VINIEQVRAGLGIADVAFFESNFSRLEKHLYHFAPQAVRLGEQKDAGCHETYPTPDERRIEHQVIAALERQAV
jgi:hypothetical protein